MKKILLVASVLLIIVASNFAKADGGSLTVSWQVLDSEVRPGGQTTVFLTVSNPGTLGARSTTLFFTPGRYLTTSTDHIDFGGLAPGAVQQTSVAVNVNPAAVSTTSYLTVDMTYYTDSVQQKTTVNIPIKIVRIPLLQLTNLTYDRAPIEPGSKVMLSFDVKNDGDGTAENVRVSLGQAASMFVAEGQADLFVGKIAPNEAVPVSFNITMNPSLTVGTYSIPITLAYLDETKAKNFSSTKYAGLTVSGTYDFIITVDSQDTLVPGSMGTVTIKIANAGNMEALYLYTAAKESQYFAQIRPITTYTGKLSSDDYDTQKFTLFVDGSTPIGDHMLQVEVNYKDPFGNPYSNLYNLTARVYAPSVSGISPALIVISILVIAAAAYTIYARSKKKK